MLPTREEITEALGEARSGEVGLTKQVGGPPGSKVRNKRGYGRTARRGIHTQHLRLGAAHSTPAALLLISVYELALLDAQGTHPALVFADAEKKIYKDAVKAGLQLDGQEFVELVHRELPIPPRPDYKPRVDADELARCVLRAIGMRILGRRRALSTSDGPP